jgi:hypothetical protein
MLVICLIPIRLSRRMVMSSQVLTLQTLGDHIPDHLLGQKKQRSLICRDSKILSQRLKTYRSSSKTETKASCKSPLQILYSTERPIAMSALYMHNSNSCVKNHLEVNYINKF